MPTAVAVSPGPRPSPVPKPQPIVYVVAGDVSVREAIEGLVSVAGWHPRTFASAQAFLSHPCPRMPSCSIVDVRLPGGDGLVHRRDGAADRPDMPVIAITRQGDVPMTVCAMKAGVADVLTMPLDEDMLLAAIGEAIAASQATFERDATTRALQERYASLSQRERDVMALVGTGLLNKQVGAELGISEVTVKTHRGRAMRKMKARSFAELVMMATALRLAR